MRVTDASIARNGAEGEPSGFQIEFVGEKNFNQLNCP
jgi:hypothetical protein